MARDLNKIPTIDELRIALEKCGCSIRPYDMVLLNNYLESITIGDQGNANIVKYPNVSALPTVGDDDTLYVITNNSLLYVWNNGAYLQISGGGGGGGTVTTWGDIIGNILNQQDLAAAFNNKVDKVSGKQLSSEDYTLSEKNKLSGIEQGAQVNPSASQIKAAYESNANTNAFTDLEKNKLAAMEGSHFRGQFVSLNALNSAIPVANIGDYAFVDLGVGQDVGKYIWDSNDVKWVIQQGQSSAMTPAQIKSGYESNANTNAYTDAEKSKLASALTSETDPTVPSWAKQATKPAYTKGEVGLSNVDNIQQATKSEFISHDSDSVRHITSAERNAWNASAGAGLNLGETSTTAYRGDRGAIAYNHSQSTHAPIDAQKNSDITKAEIEAKLTGSVTTHTHSTSQISDFPEKGNLIAGSNITITESGNNITISSTGGGGGTSIHNDLTGRSTADAHPISAITGLQSIADEVTNAPTLVAGTNITLTLSGNTLTISSTGGGGGGSSVHGDLTGRDAVDSHPIGAITGLQVALTTEENDRISGDTNIQGQINSASTLVAGSNITITPDNGNVIISSSGGGGGSSDWNDITNKPSTFTPSAHNHDADEITTGILAIGRIPTGTTASTVSLGNHTHSISSVTGLQTALNDETDSRVQGDTNIQGQINSASNLVAGSNITITPSGNNITISSTGAVTGDVEWEDVLNKPSTFAPSTHTHAASTITQDASNRFVTDAEKSTWNSKQDSIGTGTTSQFLRGDGTWVAPPNDNTTYSASTSIILSGSSFQRAALTGDVTSPVNSNTTTLANSGVTAGTYNNSATEVRPFTVDAKGRITSVGTAVTITPTWGSVSGKPATFAPSAHNHAAGEITSGVLNIGRIPTGITSSTVALGDHSHDEITNATDLTAISGYSASVKQYLTHDASGVLKWENS